METFTEWLQDEMDKRGYIQADLARKTNLATGAISQIMTGVRQPGPKFCRTLARAFGYTQEYVFRKAGLIDDREPKRNYDPELESLLLRLEHAPPRVREDVADYIAYKLRRKAKKNQTGEFSGLSG